jgi:hypothetical protein
VADVHRAHKVYDKKTGGYFNGQALVFLVLVTPQITVPVGFRFAAPGPRQVAWRAEEKRLKRLKVPKAERPPRPAPDGAYPTKLQLALELIEVFRRTHAQVHIRAVRADALYGTQAFMDQASRLCDDAQDVPTGARGRGSQRSIQAARRHPQDGVVPSPPRASI